MTNQQLYLVIGLPSVTSLINLLAIFIAILVNNRRIETLRAEMTGRFDSLGKQLYARFEAAQQLLLRVEGARR